MIKKQSLVFVLIFINLTTFAQKFTAAIDSLNFMSGSWFQKHEWGDMEEFWGKPIGNNMVCSYRCVKDGKILFYEFVVIEQSDSVPVMILRHFKPGSIGWQEKETPLQYPLTGLQHNTAIFEPTSKTLRLITKE